MTFGEVLKRLRTEKGMSQQNLADALGVKRPTITNYESGTSYPAFRQLLDLVHLFDVSSDYLLGIADSRRTVEENVEGNVEVSPPHQNEKYISKVEEDAPAKYATNTPVIRQLPAPQPLVVTVDPGGDENIVMVEERVAAGYIQHYMEPSFYKKLPVFSLPRAEFRNATFRCFEVSGNSMARTFNSGDWVVASYVENWVQNIKNGYIYVIVTPYALLVKRVTNRVLERGKIIIESDNEEYPTDEINALDVLELWYVKARFSFRFPNTRFVVEKAVRELRADFQDMQKRLLALEMQNVQE